MAFWRFVDLFRASQAKSRSRHLLEFDSLFWGLGFPGWLLFSGTLVNMQSFGFSNRPNGVPSLSFPKRHRPNWVGFDPTSAVLSLTKRLGAWGQVSFPRLHVCLYFVFPFFFAQRVVDPEVPVDQPRTHLFFFFFSGITIPNLVDPSILYVPLVRKTGIFRCFSWIV